MPTYRTGAATFAIQQVATDTGPALNVAGAVGGAVFGPERQTFAQSPGAVIVQQPIPRTLRLAPTVDPVAASEITTRILAGFTNDIPGASLPQLAPQAEVVRSYLGNPNVSIWFDPDDPALRGVFLMHKEGAVWFVNYAFGPSAFWLDYLEDVVETFIAAGQGSVPLFFPDSAGFGAFGLAVLGSPLATGADPPNTAGLRRETADAAKLKLVAYRLGHSAA